MANRLRYTPEALQHLAEIVDKYRVETPELALRFLQAFEATLEYVQENPLMFPLMGSRWRRVSVEDFPYNVFYQIEGDRLVVHMIVHMRRSVNLEG